MRPHRRQPIRLPRPWDSPGKNTGVGCHFLLQCKNTLEEINSKITKAEEQISELEDRNNCWGAEERKKNEKSEDSLRDLLDNIKCTNIQIIGVPEEEEKKKGFENIFEEIMVENFPNMGKEIVNALKRHKEFHTG